MLKRYMAVMLVLIMALSTLTGCFSSDMPPTDLKDKQPAAESANITDYLKNAGDYFEGTGLKAPKQVIAVAISEGKLANEDKAVFDYYMDEFVTAKDKELPSALVNSYKDTMSEEDAKALIKEEMVIYLGFNSVDELKGIEFTDDMRKAAAEALNKELGGSYTFEAGLDSGAYYAIDTVIKKSLIISYLKDDLANNPYYTAAGDESSEVESSEVETTEVETTEEVASSADTSEVFESSGSSESSEAAE